MNYTSQPFSSNQNQAMIRHDLDGHIDCPWITSIPPALRENRIIRSIVEFFITATAEAKSVAMNELRNILATLAENQDVQAAIAGIYLASPDGTTIERIVSINDTEVAQPFSKNDKGIVARVARTRRPYHAPDASKDPNYRPIEKYKVLGIVSNLAVPVVLPGGELLAVLNFESNQSDRKDGFSTRTVKYIEGYVGALLPHLLVLRSLRTSDPAAWCPWHPQAHGWSLESTLFRLCNTICEAIGQGASKASIWRLDASKGSAFVYATAGVDTQYKTVPLPIQGSRIEEMLQFSIGTFGTYKAQEDPISERSKRARMMGIRNEFITMIAPPLLGGGAIAAGTLHIYLNEIAQQAGTAKELELEIRNALPTIASLVGLLISVYDIQRQRIAANQLWYVVADPDENQESPFDAILEYVQQVCEAPWASLFGRRKNENRLYCVATTGIAEWKDNRYQSFSWNKFFYNLDIDHGLTAFVARELLGPLRLHCVSDQMELEKIGYVNENGPWLKFVEVGNSPPEDRRLLSIAIRDGNNLLGLLRLVRPGSAKPFSACDERLIMLLQQVIKDALSAWQDQECVDPEQTFLDQSERKAHCPGFPVQRVHVGRS